MRESVCVFVRVCVCALMRVCLCAFLRAPRAKSGDVADITGSFQPRRLPLPVENEWVTMYSNLTRELTRVFPPFFFFFPKSGRKELLPRRN